jgi:hypothetical protein
MLVARRAQRTHKEPPAHVAHNVDVVVQVQVSIAFHFRRFLDHDLPSVNLKFSSSLLYACCKQGMCMYSLGRVLDCGLFLVVRCQCTL